jgi:hypothetical protein
MDARVSLGATFETLSETVNVATVVTSCRKMNAAVASDGFPAANDANKKAAE